jgi:hypothetical protein
MSKPARLLLQILGFAWALPVTLVGFLAGLVLVPFGARIRRDGPALVFHHVPVGPGGAITLGHVILDTGDTLERDCITYECAARGGSEERVRLSLHERAHVYQYGVLGVFFPPVYFALGGVSHRNPLERAADRYAATGEGWWPWRLT